MEVNTDLEIDLEVCVMHLHEGIIDWLKRPWEERIVLRKFWYRHRDKESYAMTPEKEKPNFFWRKR